MFDKLNMGDMGKMFEQVQEQAKAMQEQNDAKIFTTKSGGGMVEVSVNGKGEVVNLDIDDTLMDDKDSLQILLMSCITDAIKMLEDDKKNSAMSMMGNMGGMNPFGGK